MKNILLALLLFQGAPMGVVTGIVRSPDGKPAAGVRVYAMQVREGAEAANNGTVLESISQTDESGKYRLEVPAGRYYIAAGSLEMPTYFPGTPDVAMARVISITSAAVIEAIDFARFVPASRNPGGILGIGFIASPNATGVVSGVIRYPDGTPAANVAVTLAPTNVAATSGFVIAGTASAMVCARSILSATPGGTTTSFSFAVSSCYSNTRTDSSGAYRLTNISPGTYYIAAGFANNPILYPGTPVVASAIAVTTTPASNIDKLDITLPFPPKGTTVRGRVVAAESLPAGGATIELRLRNPQPTMGLSMLPMPSLQPAISAPDGSFEITDVLPGTYTVHAMMAGTSPIDTTLVIGDQPVNDLRFAFPMSILLGQVLSEDGSPFADAQALREVAVVTLKNPNLIQTTILPIDAAGRFSRPLEANEYRFYVRVLPSEYTIKSMTSGGTDLLQETLEVDGKSATRVEVRLAKRTESTGLKVSGTIVDSITGTPTAARRIELCCRVDEPFESISGPIAPDGTFQVNGVPPGHYTADLRAQPVLYLTEHSIDVTGQDVSGIKLASSPQLTPLSVRINLDAGLLPPRFRISVTLAGSSGVPIPAEILADGIANAWVPGGDRYTVVASNLPDGYVVQSITNGGLIPVPAGPSVTVPPIVITLGRLP